MGKQGNTLAVAAWLGLGQPLGAAAAEAEPAVVTVTGHYDNAVGTSDSASQGAITAGLIANRPALRTGELLEFVPGMIVTQHSGDGKANQYFLRGFNLDHGTDFASFVDGMPVNMPSHAHGQGYADLNFLIPELVQRIDYKKGPYFAQEGDFASAGAARIRLADRLSQGMANLSLGAHGYRRGVLAASLKAGDGSLLYGLELQRNDGPWDRPERVRKASATLRYSAGDGNDGYSVTAMAYHNSWNASDQIPARAVTSGQIGRYSTIDPDDGGASTRYSLSYAMRRRGHDSRFELEAYALHSSLDLFSNFTYFLSRPGEGDQFSQSERRNTAGLNMVQTWLGSVAGLAMSNKLGIQTRYDRLSPVALGETVARLPAATIRADRVREGSAAVYGENLTQWLPYLRSIAGVRYDAYRFDVASSIAGAGGQAAAQIASPKLSLVFGPWRQTEYFINFGKGFHSNDARGATRTRLADGAPARPVTPLAASRGAEWGLRSEPLPGLQSSLALWRLAIDSELVFVGDAGDTEASRASRRSGFEWSNHYIAAPWLLFDLDLAGSRARYTQADAAGNFIPGSLERMLSFGVTFNQAGPWFGSFNLRHFGPRPLTEDNSVRSASSTLAYLRAGYAFKRRGKLTLDVFNLADRQASDIDYYYQSRLAGEPAAGVWDRHFHPVEPRSLRLSYSHTY